MGHLLYHPQSPSYPYQNGSSPQREEPPISDNHPVPDEESIADPVELRAYMLLHSLRGNNLSKQRQPFVGELIPLHSPEDQETIFKIKRFGNREIMIYRDKNSQVRYIYEEDDQKMITEKDYPVGSMQVDVVELGLASWNITDSKDELIPLSRESILGYLMPEELEAIHAKILEVNPILTGEKARKNS